MSISQSQLRAFHAVATEGSFTKAANSLHVTQPTLSGQVRALEERYGVHLFDRRRRKIELTDIGRQLSGDHLAAVSAWKSRRNRS